MKVWREGSVTGEEEGSVGLDAVVWEASRTYRWKKMYEERKQKKTKKRLQKNKKLKSESSIHCCRMVAVVVDVVCCIVVLVFPVQEGRHVTR